MTSRSSIRAEDDSKYGPGWTLSDYEEQETVRILQEFLGFFTEQIVHRYAVGHFLRELAHKVEEREL